MINKELQVYLAKFPDQMPIKLLVSHNITSKIIDLTEENILHTSESAYINPDSMENEWDTEDGKIELGNGQQYLLLNPIIL